jgi:hypothetical protein
MGSAKVGRQATFSLWVLFRDVVDVCGPSSGWSGEHGVSVGVVGEVPAFLGAFPLAVEAAEGTVHVFEGNLEMGGEFFFSDGRGADEEFLGRSEQDDEIVEFFIGDVFVSADGFEGFGSFITSSDAVVGAEDSGLGKPCGFSNFAEAVGLRLGLACTRSFGMGLHRFEKVLRIL